jgi:hypothetical protein
VNTPRREELGILARPERVIHFAGEEITIRPFSLARVSACAQALGEDAELFASFSQERSGADILIKLLAHAPEILTAALDLPEEKVNAATPEEAAAALAAIVEVNREPAKKALAALGGDDLSNASHSSSEQDSDGAS